MSVEIELPIQDIPRLRSAADKIVFYTRHGSKLYGLNTDSSDEDWFVVTTSSAPRATQGVIKRDGAPSLDVVTVGWDAFLSLAHSGSHQSIEALFSDEKVFLQPEYAPHLADLRLTGTDIITKYRRTIKKFSFGDFKRRRHAVRLASNLTDLAENGRFDPRLTHREAALAGSLAENLAGNALAGILLSQPRSTDEPWVWAGVVTQKCLSDQEE